MAYNTTIFGQMTELISRLEFQSIVNKHNGDFRSRKLRTWDQFIHLLFAQLSGRNSLRETLAGFTSVQQKLYHLGSKKVKRSTLSDANNKRSYLIYKELFFSLFQRAQTIAPKHKLRLDRKLFYLDASTIDLSLKLFPWARFRKTKSAVRLHTLLDADGLLPAFLNITTGKIHETTVAKNMHIPAGSYVAIDRGYYDFNLYNYLKNNNIRFVTRAKSNAKYDVVKQNNNSDNPNVLKDEIIVFSNYNTNKKYPHPLRLIHYFDGSQNKEIVFLSNDFDSEAQIIADIYKSRWEIEIFFRTIKQNLKIKRFFGISSNAVFTQIWIAMIAYLLVSLYKFLNKSKMTVQKIIRLIQVNLFERKPLNEIFKEPKYKPPDKLLCNQTWLFNF
jgi:putative transposase